MIISCLIGCSSPANNRSTYQGVWAYSTPQGNVITFYFNDGGAGYYEQSAEKDTKWTFTWEIKDGVVVATREALGTKFTHVFKLNNDGTLTRSYDGKDEGPYVKKN